MGVRTQVTNTTVYAAPWRPSRSRRPIMPLSQCRSRINGTRTTNWCPAPRGQQLIFLARTNDNGARIYARASVRPSTGTTDLSVYSATGIVTVLPGVIYTKWFESGAFPGATREEVADYSAGLPTYTFVAPGFELPADTGLNNYARRVTATLSRRQAGPTCSSSRLTTMPIYS